MIRKMLMPSVAVMGLTLVAGAARAVPVAVSAPHPAPAPLLAAGIPAFIALGGGAFIGRMVRRRKTEARNGRVGSKA
jgi:hypothetical protein